MLVACLCFVLFKAQLSISVLVSTLPGSAGVRLEDAHLFDGQQELPVLLDAVSHATHRRHARV